MCPERPTPSACLLRDANDLARAGFTLEIFAALVILEAFCRLIDWRVVRLGA